MSIQLFASTHILTWNVCKLPYLPIQCQVTCVSLGKKRAAKVMICSRDEEGGNEIENCWNLKINLTNIYKFMILPNLRFWLCGEKCAVSARAIKWNLC